MSSEIQLATTNPPPSVVPPSGGGPSTNPHAPAATTATTAGSSHSSSKSNATATYYYDIAEYEDFRDTHNKYNNRIFVERSLSNGKVMSTLYVPAYLVLLVKRLEKFNFGAGTVDVSIRSQVCVCVLKIIYHCQL